MSPEEIAYLLGGDDSAVLPRSGLRKYAMRATGSRFKRVGLVAVLWLVMWVSSFACLLIWPRWPSLRHRFRAGFRASLRKN